MKKFTPQFWIRIALFNLLIVAIWGTIMRYKIGFEFPYFNQKNLQHAHSHFAFAGWISFLLMVLMVAALFRKSIIQSQSKYGWILTAQLICSYGMLVSFSISGYGIISIVFSSLSILIAIIFSFNYFIDLKNISGQESTKWFKAALFFHLFSTLGTVALSYIMATKNIDQHSYLASVYWYLHFQYNGWFFFACVGLLIDYLQQFVSIQSRKSFNLLVISCIPAYGLSVLWLELPISLLIIVSLAAITQVVGIIYLFREIKPFLQKLIPDKTGRYLLYYIAIALSIKTCLQLGSTIPSISHFAFGFRPIVIAYLHLVLLAFTSIFLIYYLYINQYFKATKILQTALVFFSISVLFNELILAIQGFASIDYILIPLANEALFVVALLICIAVFSINLINKAHQKI